MPKITFYPHALCPQGKTVEAKTGQNILDIALDNEIELDHACEGACACTTCHVIIRRGYASLTLAEEREEDLLDRAWGLEPESRLACQAIVQTEDLEVEIPQYTINYASEHQKK